MFRIALALLLLAAPSADEQSSQYLSDIKSAFDGTVRQFRDKLKDNQSARFRLTFIRATVGADQKMHVGLCGEINAKNSYGAYDGWKTFFGNKTMLLVGDAPEDLSATMVCDPNRGHWFRENDLSAAMARAVTAP